MIDLPVNGPHRYGTAADIRPVAAAIIRDLRPDPNAPPGRTALVVGSAADRELFAHEVQSQGTAAASSTGTVFVYCKVPEEWTPSALLEALQEAFFQAGTKSGPAGTDDTSFQGSSFTLLLDDAHRLLEHPLGAADGTTLSIDDFIFTQPWSTILMGTSSLLQLQEDARTNGRLSSVNVLRQISRGPSDDGLGGVGNAGMIPLAGHFGECPEPTCVPDDLSTVA